MIDKSESVEDDLTIDDVESYILSNIDSEPTIGEHAMKVLEKRYLRNVDGTTEPVSSMFARVAANIAYVDKEYGYSDDDILELAGKFYNIMSDLEFLPNSPTLRGAGRDTMLSACSVLPIDDSRESIFNTLRDAVTLQAHGSGVGYSFSKLRAKGSEVKMTGGKASGPISFMKVYDYVIGNVIAQGGVDLVPLHR